MSALALQIVTRKTDVDHGVFLFCAGCTVLTTTSLTAIAERVGSSGGQTYGSAYGNDAAVLTVIRCGSEPQIAAQRRPQTDLSYNVQFGDYAHTRRAGMQVGTRLDVDPLLIGGLGSTPSGRTPPGAQTGSNRVLILPANSYGLCLGRSCRAAF